MLMPPLRLERVPLQTHVPHSQNEIPGNILWGVGGWLGGGHGVNQKAEPWFWGSCLGLCHNRVFCRQIPPWCSPGAVTLGNTAICWELCNVTPFPGPMPRKEEHPQMAEGQP